MSELVGEIAILFKSEARHFLCYFGAIKKHKPPQGISLYFCLHFGELPQSICDASIYVQWNLDIVNLVLSPILFTNARCLLLQDSIIFSFINYNGYGMLYLTIYLKYNSYLYNKIKYLKVS